MNCSFSYTNFGWNGCKTSDFFSSNIVTFSDYYPFGMLMPGRNGGSSYRYGMNGMEQDDEVKGNGSHLDFGARCYDSRLGRFLNTDRFENNFPHQSPYLFAGNNPILYKDANGDFKIKMTEEAKKKSGLTDVQLVRFDNILRHMESYLKENPDIVDFLVRETGFTAERILADSKYGSGPTIQIDDISYVLFGAYVPEGDIDNRPIVFDVGLVKELENFDANNTLFNWVVLATVQTILHEYTHYGDIETNGGKVTGQSPPFKDKNGKWKAKQNIKRSFNLHRGSDVDIRFFGHEVAPGYDYNQNTWQYGTGELENLKEAGNVSKLNKGLKYETDGWNDSRIEKTFMSENEDGE